MSGLGEEKRAVIKENQTIAETQDAPRADKSRRGDLLGYIFAAACLVWVLHSVDFSALAASVADINWRLVAAAILLDVLAFIVQGWRWSLLLRPIGRLSIFAATRAIYVGLFVNEILPLKLGEPARCHLAAQRLKTNFLSVVPSVVLERFFDGIWLVAGIALTAFFVRLPPNLLEAGEIFGAIIVLAIGIFILLVSRGGEKTITKDATSLPDASAAKHEKQKAGWQQKIKSSLIDFVEQVRRSGSRPSGLAAFFVSLAVLLAQAASFWLIMRAYHIEVPLVVGAAVFLIVHLGSALPGAPANVGSYQFFTVLGLTLFGVDKTLAAGFSIVVFLLLTIPLWILGFLALGNSGMTVSGLREEIGRLRLN